MVRFCNLLVTSIFILIAASWLPRLAVGDVVTSPSEAAWESSISDRQLVDFEGFSGPVAANYFNIGVTFADHNGGVPKFWNDFVYQGVQSMLTRDNGSDGGGGFSTIFSSPQMGVAFWGGDVQFSGSTVRFFDSGNLLLGTFDLYESGIGHGASAYGFNGFVSDTANIARMDVAIAITDAVNFDKLQFGVTPIPEPSSAFIASLGLLYCGVRRMTRHA